MSSVSRRLPRVAAFPLLGALALAASTAFAAGDHAPAAKGPAAKPAETRSAARAEPEAAAAPAALPPGKDPLDHLRERLAEKLGGEARPRESKAAPTVVKVTNKADEAPAPAPRGARAGAAPATRAGAASPTAPTAAGPAGHGAGGHVPVAVAAASMSAEGPSETAVRLAAIHRAGGPAAALGADAHVHAGGDVHWSYAGDGGPQAWGRLKPEFAACASGKRQSPIDIREGFRLQLEPVQFSYRPSGVRVIDNGHTVQVNVAAGNTIEVGGRRYELLQFHFHRPSEERIDGRQFDMVAHLVHKDLDGRLAVVAVLLSRGAAQPLLQTVWNNLPLEKGEEQAVREPVDLGALLPPDRRYYTYMGSLTTPPCTEGVLWMVMKTPVQVSDEQIGIFSRLYPMNARPVQSLAGRMIKESD